MYLCMHVEKEREGGGGVYSSINMH